MFIDDAFTEDRWQAARNCDDAAWMIRCIWRDTEHPSPRKSQLFVCACARRIWHLLTDERSRQGVAVAEQFLEGMASNAEVEEAADAALAVCYEAQGNSPPYSSAVAAIAARSRENRFNDWKAPNAMWQIDKSQMLAALVRDIFGNPFRPGSVHRSWLVWNDGAVKKMAQALFDGHRFTDLPILADALEDAGCDNADILSHCRSGGEHVRGCWVVDLLLGKQ
jgi:hypothetical protein